MPKCCAPPEPIDEGRDPEEEFAELAKALGHPMRVRILRILLEQEECMCGQICDQLPIAQSTVSQHLKVLREAKLVHGEVDGPRTCYCADPSRIERLGTLLERLVTLARA